MSVLAALSLVGIGEGSVAVLAARHPATASTQAGTPESYRGGIMNGRNGMMDGPRGGGMMGGQAGGCGNHQDFQGRRHDPNGSWDYNNS